MWVDKSCAGWLASELFECIISLLNGRHNWSFACRFEAFVSCSDVAGFFVVASCTVCTNPWNDWKFSCWVKISWQMLVCYFFALVRWMSGVWVSVCVCVTFLLWLGEWVVCVCACACMCACMCVCAHTCENSSYETDLNWRCILNCRCIRWCLFC